MADLNVETFRTCKANVYWETHIQSSTTGHWYTVVFAEGLGDPNYSHGWGCDCPAGQHGKVCKHIKQAEKEKCDWNWEAFMGNRAESNPDGTCPECGGETTVVQVGV